MISVFFTSCHEKDEHKTASELLREKVSSLIGCGEENIVRNENGRPCLSFGGDISVSHSHGAVAVALAYTADRKVCDDEISSISFSENASHIGVDIETLFDKTPERCGKIAERFFFKEEKEILCGMSDERFVNEFVLMWTKKEAIYKTGAAGYSSPLSVNTQILPKNAVFHTEQRTVFDKECTVALCIIQ